MITQLDATFFKGLKEFSIKPKNVNLLIGANGTGKTNFADLVEFISLSVRFGLKEVVNNRFEGLDEVRTKARGQGRPTSLSISIQLNQDVFRGIKEATYHFRLSPKKSLVVDEEQLDAIVYARSPGKPTPPAKVVFDKNSLINVNFKRKKNKIEDWSDSLGEPPKTLVDDQELMLSAYGKIGNFRTISEYLGAMRSYNIDSMLAKRSSNGSESELDRFGDNLIPFLKRVIEDKTMRERLLRDLRYAVPYIEGIAPERILGYTTLKFSEKDSKIDLRAKQMSDGTIRLLGLLAVFRQPVPPPFIVIEEPENALHSYAVKMFIRIAKEASRVDKFRTQVFLTSHSPAVVDDVLSAESQNEFNVQGFVSKRENGAGTIKPAPEQVIKGIVKNLGRPSDYLREGSFDDSPQLELSDKSGTPL
ncbi:MAG: AAA family ATPase [Ignavibacteriales bacterium]|nr:AAA family ATPase [Ignavibacteriales bacterium]